MSFSENSIGLKIDFANPLLVSSGTDPNLLLVQIDLRAVKDKQSGNRFPGSAVKVAQIPSQMTSAKEALFVNESGRAASYFTKTVIGSNVVSKLLTVGSLDQLWSFINS